MRHVIVYRTEHDDWVAECPSLPACKVRAATKPEALDAIQQTIAEYLDELKRHNAPIPDDRAEISVVLV